MDPNDTPETTPDVVAEQTPSPSETNGASSSGAADETPESAEDVIRREFLEKYGSDDGEETPDPDGEAGADPEAKPDEAAQKPETDIQSDDDEDDQFRIPDEEFKGLPSGVKQRIGHLNAKAKKAEREKAELETEMTPLRDAHHRFTTLQNYVQEHGIEPQNVTLAFDAMAKMSRGDFQGFLDAVKPFYDVAMQAAGMAISPDLQERVDNGYLTEDDAREMTKARMQAQTFQGQAAQMQQRDAERRQQDQQQQAQTDMLAAINNREAQLKASDPDYALKSPAIKAAVELALKNGAMPRTAEQAIAMIDQAYQNASTFFVKPAAPKPTPPRPFASNPSRGRPEPATTKDAITQSLRDFPG